ncbi:toll/interleukin-1 receptor domain-containing protein [Vibrio parahaemolyticus]|nr:toll/interleukin-1 receptor domain-containing protein [Vibrio parahaemolyticus]
MYKGFNLNISNTDKTHHLKNNNLFTSNLHKNKVEIQNTLSAALLGDGALDGSKLKEVWFPNIQEVDVFISHSHSDIKQAEALANWLYEKFGLRSFIDSHVWGYANDLLRKLDNKYAYQKSLNTYNYQIRNITTSHVHMMLSAALTEMIDKTECLFFINTENAIENIQIDGQDEDRTSSPWIMSELATSNTIRKHLDRPELIMESIVGAEKFKASASVPKIYHKAPTEHLTKINVQQLSDFYNRNRGETGQNALTLMYNQLAGDKLKIVSKSNFNVW